MSREKKARKLARKSLDKRRKCDPCAHKETPILLCHQRRPRLPAHGKSRFRTACLSPRRGEVSRSDGEGPPDKSLPRARGKGVLAPPGADKARAPFPQRSKNAKGSVSLQHFSGAARWIGGAKRRMRSPRSPVSAVLSLSPSPVASRHPPPLGEEQAGCSGQSPCSVPPRRMTEGIPFRRIKNTPRTLPSGCRAKDSVVPGQVGQKGTSSCFAQDTVYTRITGSNTRFFVACFSRNWRYKV